MRADGDTQSATGRAARRPDGCRSGGRRGRCLRWALWLGSAGCISTSTYQGLDLTGSTVVVAPANLALGAEAEVAVRLRTGQRSPLPQLGMVVAAPPCRVAGATAAVDVDGLGHARLLDCPVGKHAVAVQVLYQDFQGAVPAVATVNVVIPAADGGVPAGTPLVLAMTLTLPGAAAAAAPFVGPVRLVSSDPLATLPALHTVTAADGGVIAIDDGLTLRTPGVQTVTAIDPATGQTLGTQTVRVSPQGNLGLQFVGLPSTVVAGTPISFVVRVADAASTVDPAFAGNVALSAAGPPAATATGLPAALPFDAAARGSRSVGPWIPTTAGTVQLAASYAGIGAAAATVTVLPAALQRLRAQAPPTVVAGTSFVLTVRAEDAFGNLVDAYGGVLAAQTSDLGASLGTPVNAAGGYAVLPVTLRSSGHAYISLTDTADAARVALVPDIEVTPAVATHLSVTASASVVDSDVPVDLRVAVVDAFENPTPFAGTVILTCSDANVAVPSQPQLVAGEAVLAGTTLPTAGPVRFDLRDAAGVLPPASLLVSVTAGQAARLTVQVRPASPRLQQSTVAVRALDAHGNQATGYRGMLHFSSSDANALLPADTALTAADAGAKVLPGGVTFGTHDLSGGTTLRAGDVAIPALFGEVTVSVPQAASLVGHATGNSFCVLFTDGSVRCWGDNQAGQLGLGDTTLRGVGAADMGEALPSVDLGAGRRATQVAVGQAHACALTDVGSVKCWGAASSGALGLGDGQSRGDRAHAMGDALPAVDLGAGRSASYVSTGASSSCAILDTGAVKCWGFNAYGELGQGDTASRGLGPGDMGDQLPPIRLGSALPVVGVAEGLIHTCVWLADGSCRCFGYNAAGELGIGTYASAGGSAGTMGSALPVVKLGTGRLVRDMSLSSEKGCARLDDGTVKCWGFNSDEAYGDSAWRGGSAATMGDNLPAVVWGQGHTVLDLAATGSGGCVVLDDGTVKCWGSNNVGQLGLGDTVPRTQAAQLAAALPTVSLGTGRRAVAVAAANASACVLLDDGLVKCWGDNSLGELGLGDARRRGVRPSDMGDALPTVRW